jgi:hypothetical protein
LTTKNGNDDSADDSDDEMEEILSDIQEVLSLAQRQGVLPPVRIARILAGEGTGQFSSNSNNAPQRTVPLSVALDYVGEILDESRREISRLKVRPLVCCIVHIAGVFHRHLTFVPQSEVEEYNRLCNSMEAEVEDLLRSSQPVPSGKGKLKNVLDLIAPVAHKDAETNSEVLPRINIEEMYSKVRMTLDEGGRVDGDAEQTREQFWREMDQSEDSFHTIARFFSKGVIE